MRRFVRVELGDEVVPDETTILRFRHLLEQHGLTEAIFASISGLLEERRLFLRSGTIVDATIIAAPSSTKNASATRDPEMKQTRKGRNWHFGMKLHIGADTRGIVHTVRATDDKGACRSDENTNGRFNQKIGHLEWRAKLPHDNAGRLRAVARFVVLTGR
jgi:IS5 family transposase